MKRKLSIAYLSAVLLLGGCVAGPGGVNNAANRTVGGAAAGGIVGGIAGQVLGSDPFSGAAAGAVLGGALGAAVNPRIFYRDTRGYCYYVDPQGNRVYDYNRRC